MEIELSKKEIQDIIETEITKRNNHDCFVFERWKDENEPSGIILVDEKSSSNVS